MAWKPHNSVSLENLNASVVVVSDSLFSGTSDISNDISGPNAIDILSEAGISSINLDYFPDDFAALAAKVDSDILLNTDLIILIGGTGIDPRDVTIEAVKSIMDKEIPGFGEEFRRRSYEDIKERALLSRAFAGVIRRSVVVALPGSPNAVDTGLRLLLGFLGHAVNLIRKK
ncbi:MAG: MogA/MoaB family molybdenum cofactor biosynthesis protein [Candidatus Kariarchaeaceae archaeon]|jgi:molybdenum cofactor biosynthesis protein B